MPEAESPAWPPWPSFSEEEAQLVAEVLRSNRVNYWTGGEGRAFECDFAGATGTDFAIALANGTIALDLAFAALGLGAGDEVVVTPRSFVASASSVALCGARPVFADVDPESGNLTAETIAPVLTKATRAIVVVHLGGWPAEMTAIVDLAAQRGIAVVEDCAQAHGARYRARSVGGLGRVGAWSFCQDKVMTTGGEGGMITTSDPEMEEAIWALKDHGKSRTRISERPSRPGFRYLIESFGTNGRMTEMQAALGRWQLARLPEWRARRSENAGALLGGLEAVDGLHCPRPPAHVESAWYKAYVHVVPEALRTGWDRDRILAEILDAGIPCGTGVCPEIYRERAFIDAGLHPADPLPNARHLGETTLMFQVHPTLGASQIGRTIEIVRHVLHRAAR